MVGYVTIYKIQEECYLLKSCLVDAGRMLLVMAEQVFLPMGDICCLVIKLYPTLRDPTDCRMPGFPVLHHLPKFVQVHVHCTGDAIQPSHPLSPSSPSAFNLSQHQGFIPQRTGYYHQVAKVLELQFQHQSFQ